MTTKFLATACLSILLSATALSPAFAGDAAPYADTLLGDMGGARSKLAAKGVDFNLNYKADFWSNLDGGAKRGEAYAGDATFGANLDGEKLFGLHGNSASVQFINTHGGKPNAFVGSTQGVDNIEVGTPTTTLYEAWVQQTFLNDKVSALVGLRDLNAEFAVTDMTANFISPVMQIGQDFAQSGKNGPSIYPVTALGARLQVKPTATTYIQAAVFDGVAGDPDKTHGTHVELSQHDGALLVAEAGVTPWNKGDSAANKFAVGAWSYTKQFADLSAVDGNGDPILKKSEGVYAISSYQFYHDATDRTLGGFFRVGTANADVSQVEWAYEAGVVGNGWVKSRPDAEFGLGISRAHNGNHYVNATGAGTLHTETAFEAYYRDPIARGVTLQPDFQYIVNPGTTASQDDATLVGLRLDIAF